MNISRLIELFEDIKPGVFTRLTYTTELPVKAEFKKQGYKVTKLCSMTTRFGINYGNIEKVKEANKDKIQESELSNITTSWVIKNNIQYNWKTEKYYLCTYPTEKGRNTSVTYNVFTPEGNFYKVKDFDKNIVVDSYWRKKPTSMMKINIDNILRVGGKY